MTFVRLVPVCLAMLVGGATPNGQNAAPPVRGVTQRDTTIGPGFQFRLPRDVKPETVIVFFALAPSGVLPTEPLKTKPDTFDYSIPVGNARFLRLLVFVPGYQAVTAEFRDTQLDSPRPFAPPLTRLPPIRLDGRLVDSSNRPVPNQTLDLSYDLSEANDYFCGGCMLDGQIPSLRLGQTRTADDGTFSFDLVNVRDDPFFQRYAKAGSAQFLLSDTGRPGSGMPSETLRPSALSVQAAAKKPFVVVKVERGILSGHLGIEFLRQNALGTDLRAYRTGGDTGVTDTRPVLSLMAEYDHGGYFLTLNADGTFEVQLPPGSYDLNLSVLGPGGVQQRKISVEKGVIVREGQRLVVVRP